MNTGVWLYKPEWRVYAEALRVLRDGVWSKEEGFNHAGPPLALAYAPEMLERLAVGRQEHEAHSREAAFQKVRDKMAMTEYAKGPTWFFVGGNIDQGLFWYVLYVKLGVGTWAAERQARWRVHHFWGKCSRVRTRRLRISRLLRLRVRSPLAAGPGKPWGDRNAKVYARANYLQRLRQFGRFERLNGTACKRHLETLWQDLVKGGKERSNDSPGWSPLLLARPARDQRRPLPAAHDAVRPVGPQLHALLRARDGHRLPQWWHWRRRRRRPWRRRRRQRWCGWAAGRRQGWQGQRRRSHNRPRRRPVEIVGEWPVLRTELRGTRDTQASSIAG